MKNFTFSRLRTIVCLSALGALMFAQSCSKEEPVLPVEPETEEAGTRALPQDPTVSITFEVTITPAVIFGERVCMIGNVAALKNWAIFDPIWLEYVRGDSSGSLYRVTVDLPANTTVEYQFYLKTFESSGRPYMLVETKGSNHTLTTGSSGSNTAFETVIFQKPKN